MSICQEGADDEQQRSDPRKLQSKRCRSNWSADTGSVVTGFSFSQRQGGYHMGSVSLSWHKGGLWPTRCINGCLPEKGVIAQREKKGKCRLLTGEQGFSKLHQRQVCALVWGSVFRLYTASGHQQHGCEAGPQVLED